MALFPIFGPDPRFEYIGLGDAGDKVTITEMPGAADVNSLAVHNSCPLPVLLYPGEALLGAQQDRMVDVPVVVPAHAKTHLPVSCVEAGRWDASQHRQGFVRARQFAPRNLRETKTGARAVAEDRVAAGRAAQSEVWGEVSAMHARLDSRSPTESVHDAFDARGSEIDGIEEGLAPVEGQAGVVVAIGTRIVAFELVSRPLVFKSIWGRLVRSFALDAVDLRGGAYPTRDKAEAFVRRALARESQRGEAVGAGIQLGIGASSQEAPRGVGLEVERELIQLSVSLRHRPSVHRPPADSPLDSMPPKARPSTQRRPCTSSTTS